MEATVADAETERKKYEFKNELRKLFELYPTETGLTLIMVPPVPAPMDTSFYPVIVTAIPPEKKKQVFHHPYEKMEYRTDIIVPASRVFEVLSILQTMCDPTKQKGKRFKESHDLRPHIVQDLFVSSQVVYAYKMTIPRCVLCSRRIPQGADRCKFSISNMKEATGSCEKCGTHVYCLFCYLILQAAVRLGMKAVCVGTLLTDRGGCRQMKVDDILPQI
jgi:hypothetical protein